MSGLRETKKAATRTTMSRAAARLALAGGAESLTVAAVSDAAGVSPRTFHNYFTSMEQALLEFIVDRSTTLARLLNDVPAEVGLFDAVEQVAIDQLRTSGDDGDVDSLAALFRLGDVLQTITGSAGRPEYPEHMDPIVETVLPRFAGADRFTSQVAINTAVTVARTALETYYALPEPRDPEDGVTLLHRAFSVVRLE
ncbi:TetR/AcrR family transcriptional regulator [Corynebacterium suedekumii]|uniref:TetR family transcriptional regulator n=1 Tax=Corynebacterium suedekumii TaxID=3049801 RepID=A0ABY8VHX8_9CORY|nr:TetR/AcrR family transcriptional regulator [Corynebacterium suedekumii]WIM69255.1 TetR family transcriptional regulator [Corynebacterium suedekumii]